MGHKKEVTMQGLDVRLNSHQKKSFLSGRAIKIFFAAAVLLCAFGSSQAQELKTIKLNSPDKDKGFSVMKSLSLRQSTKDTNKWSEKELSLQDLSNLLWAGNGVNREDGKRTAASAMNSQDVDIFVLMKDGIYLYDAANNALKQVVSGDHRSEIGMGGGGPGPAGAGGAPGGAAPAGAAGGQPVTQGSAPGGAQGAPPAAGQGAPAGGAAPARSSFNYPVKVLLVSETGKFRAGTAELKKMWGIFDAGLVAQNMSLYCSGMGLVSHPKAAVDTDGKIKNLLKLTDTQVVVIELDIGYPK
jgi:hypothetical protein